MSSGCLSVCAHPGLLSTSFNCHFAENAVVLNLHVFCAQCLYLSTAEVCIMTIRWLVAVIVHYERNAATMLQCSVCWQVCRVAVSRRTLTTTCSAVYICRMSIVWSCVPVGCLSNWCVCLSSGPLYCNIWENIVTAQQCIYATYLSQAVCMELCSSGVSV